jgi:predicted RNase H-like HicB family nuclease
MTQSFTLEYWIDDGWYVGRLKGVLGVFSQGESLADLEENIRDAYQMMIEEEGPPPSGDAHVKQIEVSFHFAHRNA